MKSRKELLNEYKNRKFRIGVFRIRNTINGKVLIDSSVDLDKIWNRHRTELSFGSHRNVSLLRDWNLYGEYAFVFEVLAEVQQSEQGTEVQFKKEAKELAKMFINEIQPFGDKGYH